MLSLRSFVHNFGEMICTLLALLLDAARFLVLCLRPAPALAAENLFLRKQLAQFLGGLHHDYRLEKKAA
jgi:hypothetical protein